MTVTDTRYAFWLETLAKNLDNQRRVEGCIAMSDEPAKEIANRLLEIADYIREK